MKDPVIIESGHSFERTAIEEWLQKHTTCPKTNTQVDSSMVITNQALKSAIST